MAGKKTKAEVEALKTDIASLTEAVWALRDQVNTNAAHQAVTASSKANIANIPADEFEQTAVEAGESGAASVRGFFQSDAGRIRWTSANAKVSSLTDVPAQSAATLLAAVGHPQRIAILNEVLQGPTSASELVANLKLGTTGAAYHHLNVLQTAGLITQVSRGVFRFQPERIPVFLTIMAAVSDEVRVQVD